MHLSEESGNVLANIPKLKLWRVQPTMTRGTKAADAGKLTTLSAKVTGDGKKEHKSKTKKKEEKKQKKNKSKKSKKSKKDEDGHIPETKAPNDITANDIKRTAEGRQAIAMIVQEIQEIDADHFPDYPIFDKHGRCRMDFPGAIDFTWAEILSESGSAVQGMHLGKICWLNLDGAC